MNTEGIYEAILNKMKYGSSKASGDEIKSQKRVLERLRDKQNGLIERDKEVE